jgi:hypothetical protein
MGAFAIGASLRIHYIIANRLMTCIVKSGRLSNSVMPVKSGFYEQVAGVK